VSLQASGDESMVFASDYRGLSQSQKLDGRGYLVRRGTPELLQVALPLGTDAGEVAGT
jgi:S-DNA-T family DNA segregation ATPase FtsK/SpoIIIE